MKKRICLDKSDKATFLEDWKVLEMFVWLFLGFLIGFCLLQIAFQSSFDFNTQLQTYCVINSPLSYTDCLNSYSLNQTVQTIPAMPRGEFLNIFVNNVYVSFTVLIMSLIFGAGAIFVIIWNASIISTAIALSIKYQLRDLPIGLLRFLIHGIPEVASYLLFAIAGGITSLAFVSFLKGKISKDELLNVVRRSSYIAIGGIIVLIISALIEVFLINHFFG